MAIEAVLFDLDNTLLDLLEQKRSGSRAAFRAMVGAGADFPFDEEEGVELLFKLYLENLESNDVFESFVKRFHRQSISLNGHNRDRMVAAAVNAYLRDKLVHGSTYPGTLDVLSRLLRRGYHLAVLTDAPRFKAYQRIEAAGLGHLLDFILTPDDTGVLKPKPRGFTMAVERWGLAPPQVLMVGDSFVRDLAGAQAAGLPMAWAKYGSDEEPGPVAPKFTLERIHDLLDVLPNRS